MVRDTLQSGLVNIYYHLSVGSIDSIDSNCCGTFNSMIVVVKATEQCGKQSLRQHSALTSAI